MSLQPVRLPLVPPDLSFIIPPLLSVHPPRPPPSTPFAPSAPSALSYLYVSFTPYLDRSHDCCNTSWLTAHLHVFQLHSLIMEIGGGGGAKV